MKTRPKILLGFAVPTLVASLCGVVVFRANTNLVTLTFSVRNSSGALVENLTKDDVEIFEDTIPQKISFSR